MSKTLVIVESPAKCKKIESYLGSGYKCIASFGHIRNLNSLDQINIANSYKVKFINDKNKSKQIKLIKDEYEKCKKVIIATDDDREGEAIGWHICEILKINPTTTPRIIFHEITRPALTHAVNNPTTLNMNVINAQLTRQILDLFVGYKISPLLWKVISGKGLSAGRCQTPALRLIYDNQKLIDNQPGTLVYDTTGYFTKFNLPFILDHNHDSIEKMDNYLEECVNFDHKYSFKEPYQREVKPPLPFTTSTLQQVSSNILHYSPKRTMSICQKLYEGGYITYMRTDSKKYSANFIENVTKLIIDKYDSNYINSEIELLICGNNDNENNKKKKKDNNVQEAHEAIRVTNITQETLPASYNNEDKRMYKLIWNHSMKTCMAKALLKVLKCNITAYEEHNFKYTCEDILFPGWKIIDEKVEKNPYFDSLMYIEQNSNIEYNKITSIMKLKDLKTHYTEAKLVQLLEEKGIGRPSTFSSLVDKIQTRGYVEKRDVQGKDIECTNFELIDDTITTDENKKMFGNEKNKLVITNLGLEVLEYCINNFDLLFNYDYTKNMENDLDKIAKNEINYVEICNDCYNMLTELLQNCSTEKVNKNSVREKALNVNLGTYENANLILKKGKFGYYVVYGENKCSLTGFEVNDEVPQNLNIEELTNFIKNKNAEKQNNKNKNMVRILDENISIRNGKYGDYIFYKTSKMKSPKFLKLKSFKEDYKTCELNVLIDWIKETYKI